MYIFGADSRNYYVMQFNKFEKMVKYLLIQKKIDVQTETN
jgi:hypothetical protein